MTAPPEPLEANDPRGSGAPPEAVPGALAAGVRWLATALVAAVLVAASVGLRGPDGPRPWPLLLTGVACLGLGLAWRRRRPDAPTPEATVVVGVGALLLAAEAFVRPDADGLVGLLLATGAAATLLGFAIDDRRPVVAGAAQWAAALARPGPDADVFRHCLVASDVALPMPRVLPVMALGVGLLVAAEVARRARWRPEASRGLETSGLALLLGGLAAKALELPGHPALCGTGDAIDLGWALVLLACAAAAGAVGVARGDAAWASAGLAAGTLFGLVAAVLERNPLWALVVAVAVGAVLWALDHRGVPWPRRTWADSTQEAARGRPPRAARPGDHDAPLRGPGDAR